jgi:hypothetical protein
VNILPIDNREGELLEERKELLQMRQGYHNLVAENARLTGFMGDDEKIMEVLYRMAAAASD